VSFSRHHASLTEVGVFSGKLFLFFPQYDSFLNKTNLLFSATTTLDVDLLHSHTAGSSAFSFEVKSDLGK